MARTKYAFENNLIDLGNEPSFWWPGCSITIPGPTPHLLLREKIHDPLDAGRLSGNEDSGAMSSLVYIFSALGFFVAGQDLYLINGPLFKKCTIQLENGKKLVVEGINASEENIYVAALTINGEEYDKNWLRHSEIKRRGAGWFFRWPPSRRIGAKTVPVPASFPAPSIR